MTATSSPRRRPPRSSLAGVVRYIYDLAPENFARLSAAVAGDEGLTRSPKRIVALAASLGVSRREARTLLDVLKDIYEYLHDTEDGPLDDAQLASRTQDIIDALPADTFDVSEQSTAVERLSSLVAYSPTIVAASKRTRLRNGFLPTAIAFESFVDLRPNFPLKDGKVDEPFELLKVIQLRIETDTTHPRYEHFLLQLTEDSLQELKDAIAKIDAKLLALDRASLGSKPIR